MTEYTVLPKSHGGGPHGLGDPNDRSLRNVEREVLIPKIIRERTKLEKCVPEVKDFNDCCIATSLMMVVKCRKENTAMQDCYGKWYRNPDFVSECTEQYLTERSEYRRTGIPKKYRKTQEQK